YPGAHVDRFPEKPAVVLAESGEVLTYRELEDNSVRLARHLHDAGLRSECKRASGAAQGRRARNPVRPYGTTHSPRGRHGAVKPCGCVIAKSAPLSSLLVQDTTWSEVAG
ncbi:hypothetical protein, partial [Nocardia asiatica]|uniref:hypothetical protein n=1 Tax=Nocardia asiatica TaxID=209252 RepID=UPI0024569FAD